MLCHGGPSLTSHWEVRGPGRGHNYLDGDGIGNDSPLKLSSANIIINAHT